MKAIRFNDKWCDDEEILIETTDIKHIDKDEKQGLFIIENIDGLFFACETYQEVNE